MVPDAAKRFSSPVKALSMKVGLPGKIYTLRTLTWKKKVDASYGKNKYGSLGLSMHVLLNMSVN